MYDESIEKTMLFYLIFEEEEINLDIEDFFIAKNKQIFKAVQELKAKKEEVNIISIKNKVKGKDTNILAYLGEIAESRFGSSLNYTYKEIKRLSKKRKMIKLNKNISDEISNVEDIDIYIEKQIKELNNINQDTAKEKSFLEMLVETSDIITEKQLKGTEYDYKYFTGIFDLDKATNGLHEEELTIIGARPGVGKTTFALKIAHNIANKGTKVAIISLEMSETQIIQKLIAKQARVDSNKLRTGTLEQKEQEKVDIAIGEISDLPLFLNTKVRNIEDIEIYARRMKNKENIGLLIIDYIQLIKSKGKFNSREQEVAEISRTLKLLSLELKIPIIRIMPIEP